LPHEKVEVALADFVLMADVELEGGGVGAYLVEEFDGWAEGAGEGVGVIPKDGAEGVIELAGGNAV